jgi:iron complex outermembrane receptor protein
MSRTDAIRGTELLLRYRREAFTLTGSYVFVDSSEPTRRALGGARCR